MSPHNAIAVLGVAGTLLIGACTSPEPQRREASIRHELREGRDALHAGRPREALNRYREVLRLDPTYAPAMAGVAQAQIALGDFAAARSSVDAALATPQAGSQAGAALWRVRAQLRRHAGDADGALADLDQSLRLQPLSKSSLTARGDVLMQLGRFDDAIRDWEAVGRIDPASRDAARIGRAHAAAGRPAQGAAALREAAALSLGDGLLALDLYLAARRAGEPEDAVTSELARHRALFARADWPMPLLDRYLGRIDDGAVDAVAAQGGSAAAQRQEQARRYLNALRRLEPASPTAPQAPT